MVRSLSMKSVLITGGAGFIGSHLADAMVKKGYRVVILDNLSTGEKRFVPKQAVFIKGDVSRISDVRNAFGKFRFDLVMHVAGQASQIQAFSDPAYDLRENFEGTVNLVTESVVHGVPRFLFASSMTVYGASPVPVSETWACVPVSYYAISKYAAERFVLATAERTDLMHPFHATSFRMFNVYGPRQSLTNPYQGAMAILTGNIVRNEPVTIYGDGRQTRDFIYIDDVVAVWLSAIENKHAYQEVFNLGYGAQISMNSLVKKLLRVYEKPASYPVRHAKSRPGEQRYMQADMRKVKKILGIIPSVSVGEGILRTKAWVGKQK